MIPFDVVLDGDDAWPELANNQVFAGELRGVAVLGHGTTEGRPSVTFRVDLDGGKTVLAQTSARLFCTAAKMIMAKYPDLFEGD
jgi:hypothetical protein